MKSKLPFLLMAFILGACYENSFLEEIPEVDLEDNFSIRKIEFTDILYSSYFEDSLITSTQSAFLLGNHTDENRGRIAASPYFEFELETSNMEFADEHVLDSITFVMKVEDSHFDTLPAFTLNIYQLTERLEYKDNNEVFYDFESSPIESSPLVSQSIQYLPSRDSIRITLPLEFGADLLEKGKSPDQIFETNEDFLDYFHGFHMSIEGQSPLMLLSKESYIALYYQTPQELQKENMVYKIPIGDASLGYTHLEADRSGTAFSQVQNYVQTSSSETQGIVIGDELSNSKIRIDLGDLTYLNDVPYDYYISEAYLYLPIKKGTYDGKLNLPLQEFDVYVADKNNHTKNYLAQATLTRFDEIFQEETYFQIPITEFVESQIRGSRQSEGLWLEATSNTSYNLGYLIVGENSTQNKSKIEITIIPLN